MDYFKTLTHNLQTYSIEVRLEHYHTVFSDAVERISLDLESALASQDLLIGQKDLRETFSADDQIEIYENIKRIEAIQEEIKKTESMIEIIRNDTKVWVQLESGLYGKGNEKVSFMTECNNTMFAELIEKRLNDQMELRIEAVRKQEYESGYKDGRAKRKKRDYFWVSLTQKSY